MSTENLDKLFVELNESDMAATTGGVSAKFLNRWAARFTLGTANLTRIDQRLVNAFYKGTLTKSSLQRWEARATTTPAAVAAWKQGAPSLVNTLSSGNIVGATSGAINAVTSFLSSF
jgi:hypothetical protein